MLSLTLAQARAHAGRYLASVLAVLIAVAFVVATLVLGATTQAGITNSLAGQYRNTDVVVADAGDAEQAGRTALAVGAVAGVRAVTVDAEAAVRVSAAAPGKLFGTATSLAVDEGLRWQRLSGGRFPEAPGEVAVGSGSGLPLGSRVAVTALAADTREVSGAAIVVGEVDLSGSARRMGGVSLFVTADQLATWAAGGAHHEIRVAAADGDPSALAAAVVGALGPDAVVRTGAEQADAASAEYLGGADVIRNVLLAFAAIAVVVSGLVIANTFAVLVAARTREMALLRCIGATGAQVRRGVRIEALAVGLVASVAGVVAGIGLAWAVTRVAGAMDVPVPLDTLGVSPTAVGAGLAVGLVVTYLAAMAPARAATRVAPLAALAPVEARPEPASSSSARTVGGVAGLLGGAGVLAAGVHTEQVSVACGGGILLFLGVVLLGRSIVPAAVAALGRAPARLAGPLGELAVGNALRNPRRTTATATALLVGVTVTATMVVGIAAVGASAPKALDEQFPVDVTVVSAAPQGIPADLERRVGTLERVTAVAPLLRAEATDPDGRRVTLSGVDPDATRAALRIPLALPQPGQVSLSPEQIDALGTAVGQSLVLDHDGVTRTLTVIAGPDGQPALVGRSEVLAMTPAAVTESLWIRLADGLTDEQVNAAQSEIADAAGQLDPTAEVGGAVAMRAALTSVLDTLLLIVVGLLSVAIVIALIGVGNTMALSVLERRRESGLLRAVGVSRAGLRTLLVYEAVLVAVVASALGVLLGLVLGLAGTASVFGVEDVLLPSSVWLTLVVIVLVGGVAGVAAAVLPARSAARVSPVQALAA
ncbi:FtsX-like permease family protein [Rhodococcus kronopolitis]|uniref:FtsX-like permease family protein n=1 Tax=Rhodococcus kronopolitis TaxID=1460226 RepID=A0ABV9FQH8_9NOCA